MADNTTSGSLRINGHVGIWSEPLSNAQLCSRSETELGQIFIENSIGTLVKLAATGNRACLGTDSACPLELLTNNTPRFSITDTGQCGIGTTTPTALLDINGDLKLQQGGSVTEFSNDGTLGDNSDQAIPTEKAVKEYVDTNLAPVNTALADKANLHGSSAEDFAAKQLTVQGTLHTQKLQVDQGGTLAGGVTIQNDLKVNGNLEVDGTTTFRNIEQHQGDVELGNEDTDEIRIHGILRSTHSSGKLQISSPTAMGTPAVPANLQVHGEVSADGFQGNGTHLTGVVKQTGDTMTGPLTVTNTLLVSGAVGIGTTAPTHKLEVAGTVKATEFQGDGSKLTGIAGSQWTQDSSGNLSYSGGNVGLGTALPHDKLDIDGALRFNGKANRRVYGASRAGSDAVVLSGRWDELEVKGRVIDWTGSNLHIGYDNDHSNHSLFIGNGKLKTVAIQGNTSLTVGGTVAIGTTNSNAPLTLRGNGGQLDVSITQNQVGGNATMELTTADASNQQATRLLLRGNSDYANVEFYRGGRGQEKLGMVLTNEANSSNLTIDGKLHIQSDSDVAPGKGGCLTIGSLAGVNLAIDNNEIMASNSGSAATLHLQNEGGTVKIGGDLQFSDGSRQSTANFGKQRGKKVKAKNQFHFAVFHPLQMTHPYNPPDPMGRTPFVSWASVDEDGKIEAGSADLVTAQGGRSTWNNNNKWYEFSIPGLNYHSNNFATVVTKVGDDYYIPATNSVNGKLLISFLEPSLE
jgi:hypothetical protein